MSPRGLLALILLLAAAVGTLYWLDHRKAPEAVPSGDAALLPSFTEAEIGEIGIAGSGADVTLRREGSKGWRVVDPFSAEADPRRVREIVAALQDARARKTIAPATADLAAYGLSPAAVTVTLTKGTAAPVTLRIGRGSPVGTERYAIGEGTGVVFADAALYAVLSRGAESLRETRLFPVEAADITRIELVRPDGRIALSRIDDAWRLTAPVADVASASDVSNLARAIATLELTQSERTPAPTVVRPERRIAIGITVAGAAAPLTAYVATLGIEGTRLGWREGGGLAGLLTEGATAELVRPAEALRETRLASFSLPDVRGVAIERAGGKTLRATRADGAKPWIGDDAGAPFAVDDGRLTALLDRLRGVSASGFLSEAPASKPTATVVVSGEKTDLVRYSYGPLPPAGASGETLWMTSSTRPGVRFTVPAESLGPIPASASDLAPVRP